MSGKQRMVVQAKVLSRERKIQASSHLCVGMTSASNSSTYFALVNGESLDHQ